LSEDQPRRGEGLGGGRFVSRQRDESDVTLDEDVEAKRERGLERTRQEAKLCFDDGQTIIDRGQDAYRSDPLIRRAAKHVVTELAEKFERLPERFKHEHADVPRRAINGTRNSTLH